LGGDLHLDEGRDDVEPGKVQPARILSQELSLDETAEDHRDVDDRLGGWTDVVPHHRAAHPPARSTGTRSADPAAPKGRT